MTEQIAKNKWCPMFRIDRHGNRLNFGGLADGCLASNCMMWRWELTPTVNPSGEGHGPYSKTEGYCGVGGKP